MNRTLSCAALAAFAVVSTAHAAKDTEQPPPIPPIAAVVDMGLVQQNKYVNCRDGTYSAMVGKRAVWTFNDTCLSSGGVLGDQFIDNTLAWNTNLDASNGIYLNKDKKDADGVPVRFVPLTVNEIAVNAQYAPNEIAIWPGQLVDDPARQRELIFYGAVFRGSDIGFHGIGGGIAVADPTFTKVTRPAQSLDPNAKEPSYMWQAGEVQYTSGYLKLGDMLYCYGGTGVGLSTDVHVARVPLADVLDKTKWTYWTGTEWSDKNQDLATIYVGGAAGDTLFWSDYLGVYVSVYQHFADNTVFYRVSNHPEGPWSDEKVMFVAAQGTDTSYAARVHNEYDENGGQTIYVTYVKNTGFLLQELPLTKVTFGADAKVRGAVPWPPIAPSRAPWNQGLPAADRGRQWLMAVMGGRGATEWTNRDNVKWRAARLTWTGRSPRLFCGSGGRASCWKNFGSSGASGCFDPGSRPNCTASTSLSSHRAVPMRLMKQAAFAGSILTALVGAHASGLDGDTMNYSILFPGPVDAVLQGRLLRWPLRRGARRGGTQYFGRAGNTGYFGSPDQVVFSGGDAFTADPFNGFVLTQLSANPLTSVTVDRATTMTGFNASDVSFNATSISVNWEGLSENPGQTVVLDVNAVPEPADYALILAGLGVIGLAVRRSRSDSRAA